VVYRTHYLEKNMSLGIAVLISFASFFTLWVSLPPRAKSFIIKHKAPFNFILHGAVIWMFIGTFSGLMQAEATAVLFTISLEVAAWLRATHPPQAEAKSRMRQRIDAEKAKSAS